MAKKRKNKALQSAGQKGGRISPTNFKNNPALARRAGIISGWKRRGGKLEDMPLEASLIEDKERKKLI